MALPFSQVDVFSQEPFRGNPVAVVHDAEGLTPAAMASFARWTNLSETTFLLAPTPQARAEGADYRLRIFTPGGELPFAGHPTLGSARAWLQSGGVPRGDRIVQECGVGLIEVRREGDELAFAAPPLRRTGPPDDATLSRALTSLGLGIGRRRVSPPRGSTTGRGGWACCSTMRGRCWGCSPTWP